MSQPILFLLSGCLILAQLAQAATPSAEETNREIMQTLVHFHIQQKEYDEAEDALADHLINHREDGSLWNLLGLIQMKARKYRIASRSFRKAIKLTRSEKRGIYFYNIADALNRYKKSKKARRYLVMASRYDEVSVSAQNAMEKMKSGEPLPEMELQSPSKWRSFFALSSGYDSNVTLLSDESLATTSVGDAASFNVSPSFSLGYERGWETRVLNIDSTAAFSMYTQENAKRFNSLYGELHPKWEPVRDPKSRHHWRIGNSFSATFLNENQKGLSFFTWKNTLYPEWEYVIDKMSLLKYKLGAYFQNYSQDGNTAAEDDRAGPGANPSIKYQRKIGRAMVSIGTEYELHLARGANYKAHTVALPLNWGLPLRIWDLSGLLLLEPSRVIYFKASNGRSDTHFRTSYTLTKPISNKLAAALNLSFRKNFSNILSARYTKYGSTMTVTYVF